MAAERPRRAREPRGDRLPARDEHARLRRSSRRDDDRRGIDRLAAGLAPGPHRRARLRLQVEHGLDARHARIHEPRPDPPPLPSSPDDVRHPLRLHREFRAADLATTRWCTAKARCSPRCPATAGRSSPICAPISASCGRIPARSCCSWAASSRRSASGTTTIRSTGISSTIRRHRRSQSLVRDLNRLYREMPALHVRDAEPAGFEWLDGNDADNSVLRLCPPRPATATRRSSSSATSRRWCARATASACRAPGAGSSGSTPTRRSTAAPNVGNAGAVETEAVPWHGRPASLSLTLPPLATIVLQHAE